MQYLYTALLLLALHLPGQASAASSLTCQIIPNRIGQPVCWCKSSHPASRWQVYPLPVCWAVNR